MYTFLLSAKLIFGHFLRAASTPGIVRWVDVGIMLEEAKTCFLPKLHDVRMKYHSDLFRYFGCDPDNYTDIFHF